MNINENRVREFAHQIWESEGCPDGHAARHWEMACKLAAADETDESDQQQAAPQHTTVANNDLDIINKPKSKKASALKKSEVAVAAGVGDTATERLAPSDLNSAAPAKPSAKKTKKSNGNGEDISQPQGPAEHVSFAKSDAPKTARQKKAKLLKDTLNTELSITPGTSGTTGV